MMVLAIDWFDFDFSIFDSFFFRYHILHCNTGWNCSQLSSFILLNGKNLINFRWSISDAFLNRLGHSKTSRVHEILHSTWRKDYWNNQLLRQRVISFAGKEDSLSIRFNLSVNCFRFTLILVCRSWYCCDFRVQSLQQELSQLAITRIVWLCYFPSTLSVSHQPFTAWPLWDYQELMFLLNI